MFKLNKIIVKFWNVWKEIPEYTTSFSAIISIIINVLSICVCFDRKQRRRLNYNIDATYITNIVTEILRNGYRFGYRRLCLNVSFASKSKDISRNIIRGGIKIITSRCKHLNVIILSIGLNRLDDCMNLHCVNHRLQRCAKFFGNTMLYSKTYQ